MTNAERVMTKDQFERLQSLAAVFANCGAVNETEEPDTLSLKEIQQFGSDMLAILEDEIGSK